MKKFKQAVAVILCVTMLSSVLTIAPVTACASETSQKESTAFESGVSFYTEATPEAASETTETIETQPETAMPVKEAIGEAVGVEAPEPAQEDGFTFVISEGCAAITAYEGDRSVTHLVIPNQLGGCPVTAIRENVFSGADYLQEVVISDSVTEIGGSSFGGCTALNHIQLPSKLEKLGPLAFNGCTGLTEITLPKTLTTVDVDWNYTSPFVRCENLKKVVFEAGMAAVPAYICRDVTSLEEVVIPEGVTVIGQYAFQNCAASLISNLNLPQSICEIRSGAFGAGEFELSLPDNIRLVASNAFGCDVVARNGSRTVVTLINSGHPFSFTAKNKPEMPVLNVLESHMELTSTSKLKIKCSYSVKDDEFEKLSDMYVKIRLPEFAELDYDTIYRQTEADRFPR